MARRYMSLTSGSLILGSLLGGCASGPHSAAGAPATTLVIDNRVVLEQPVILFDHGSLDISGGLHRQPTLYGQLTGRVDIEFISPDGQLLDELPALLLPHEIKPGQSCTYHTTYGYIPPKGSTLRIHFVDSETESREDIDGGFADSGGGGGGAHADDAGTGNHAAAGNNHYAGHGGYGGSFGNTNFSPNGRH